MGHDCFLREVSRCLLVFALLFGEKPREGHDVGVDFLHHWWGDVAVRVAVHLDGLGLRQEGNDEKGALNSDWV